MSVLTRNSRPRVTLAAHVVVERDRTPVGQPDRMALMAQWSPSAALSRSTSTLALELLTAGYHVVVSSTCPDPDPLRAHPDVPLSVADLTVLRRPNSGYDFGSWAVAMEHVAPLLGADKVLVVNDSLVGPFASMRPVIADFESTTADVWGMVESRQAISHLQSYFRGFRFGALAEPSMRAFWQDIRVIPDKSILIAEYEFGFTPFLRRRGYSRSCFVHSDDVVWGELNPTIHGWRKLLYAGVPFVKRELLRRPDLAPDGHLVRRVLSDEFGVDVDAWW